MIPDKIMALDEAGLRLKAGRWLNPGPWRHDWSGHRWCIDRCNRCHRVFTKNAPATCSVPPSAADRHVFLIPQPAAGPLEVIVKDLTQRTTRLALENAIDDRYGRVTGYDADGLDTLWAWFVYQPSLDQLRCCLLALQGEQKT